LLNYGGILANKNHKMQLVLALLIYNIAFWLRRASSKKKKKAAHVFFLRGFSADGEFFSNMA
jgi:hypothetical protein